MTTAALGLVGLTLVIAAIDWYAVAAGRKPLEYAAKPATMVALFAATLALDVERVAVQRWFLVAIVFSLAGDVFLMLPRDLFQFGLAAFLFGHVAYIVGMFTAGIRWPLFGVGVVIVLVAMATLGRRVVGAVRASHPQLTVPVVAYVTVISVMVASAYGVANAVAVVGATLFYGSDATIAWTRFIRDIPHGRLIIMVTYHLGQLGLVLSLVS